ncbi:hypothetical protein U1Q18_041241 [Sarracenia purpurea var. burkii]
MSNFIRLNAAIKAQGSSWAANGAPRGNWVKGRNGFSAAFRQDVLLKSDSYPPSAALVVAFRLGFPALAALVASSVRASGSAKPTLLCQLYQLVQLCS